MSEGFQVSNDDEDHHDASSSAVQHGNDDDDHNDASNSAGVIFGGE